MKRWWDAILYGLIPPAWLTNQITELAKIFHSIRILHNSGSYLIFMMVDNTVHGDILEKIRKSCLPSLFKLFFSVSILT